MIVLKFMLIAALLMPMLLLIKMLLTNLVDDALSGSKAKKK